MHSPGQALSSLFLVCLLSNGPYSAILPDALDRLVRQVFPIALIVLATTVHNGVGETRLRNCHEINRTAKRSVEGWCSSILRGTRRAPVGLRRPPCRKP